MIRAEDIRAAVSIDRLLQIYNYIPNRAGYISCPFHSGDKSPSLRIYADQDSWHCFGCQRGGTVIDFVMQHESLSFREAIKYLAETFGVSGTPINRKQIALSSRVNRDRENRINAKRSELRRIDLWISAIRERFRPSGDYTPNPVQAPDEVAHWRAELSYQKYIRKEVEHELDELTKPSRL